MFKKTMAKNFRNVGAVAISAVLFASTSVYAHPHDADYPLNETDHNHANGWVHENGIGPDPDGDSNPATNTRVIPFVADAAEATDDPPYTVISFEPPPGKHGEPIRVDFKSEHGVKFGKGLSWQICEGQRRFQYDTMCTYEAPTSGRFAAGYLNYLNTPLPIEFEKPVCVVTMSIYPTGAKEGEPFVFTIEGWNEANEKLSVATAEFDWTNNTVRWKNMAGAYFVDQRAKRITVSMQSKDGAEKGETLRYLIDDFAFVDEGCDTALDEIKERTGVDLRANVEPTNEKDTTIEEFIKNLEPEGS